MSRDFVIWTGLAGARALNDAVYDVAVREPLIEKTKLLLKLNLINKPKYKSLISMIESPDCENVELADIIIDISKSTQDVNPIHSGNAQI